MQQHAGLTPEAGDPGMGDTLGPLVAMNLSHAARAYWIGLRALDLGAGAIAAPIAAGKAAAARRELESARAAIEQLAAETGLAWQTVPIDRLLRTQANRVRDALYYASPPALQGYGDLQPAVAAYLTAWRRSVDPLVEALEAAVAGRVVEVQPPDEGAAPLPAVAADALSAHQRPALIGFARAFESHLLLLEARGGAALPPGHPTLTSVYDTRTLMHLLALAGLLEQRLHVLTAAFALDVPGGIMVANIVQRAMHDALECLSQLSGQFGPPGSAANALCARLCVLAHQHETLALNLA